MNKKRGNTSRILAILCAVTMVVTLFPAGLFSEGAYAAEETAVETAAPAAEKPAEEKTEQAAPAETPQEENASPAEPAKTETSEAKKTGESSEKAAPAKEETKAEAQKTETEKKDVKDAEEKKDAEKKEVFKAEFDLTDNYAHFNQISEKTSEAGGKYTLPKKPEARKTIYKASDGKEYYFTGWEYKGKEYEPGDTLTLKADAKFRAIWKQTYTIDFSAKGIKADEVDSQVEVFGEPVVLPDETATKEGYDFIGWTPDNGDTVYEADTLIAASQIQPKRSAPILKLKGVTADTSEPDVYIQYVGKKSDVECVTFKVVGVDKGSGIEKLEAKIPGHAEMNDWQPLEEGFTADVKNGQTIYARATDKAGNVSDEKSVKADFSKDYDTTAPTITINKVDNVEGEAEATVPKTEHTIAFSVNEAGCSLRAFVSTKEITDKITGNDASGYILTISGSDLEESETVTIIAADADDNYAEKTIDCKFDVSAPSITEFSMTGAQNGYYYSANNAWTLTAETDEEISEAVFKIGEKTFTGTINGNEATVTINKAKVLEAFTDTESEYTVSVIVKDLAGIENTADNQVLTDVDTVSGTNENKKIVVDTVAPKLASVTTTPQAAYAAAPIYYYSETASTAYTVTEENPGSLKLDYSANIGEEGSAESTTNTLTVQWTGSPFGLYRNIRLSGADLAGNKLTAKADDFSDEDQVSRVTDAGVEFAITKIIDARAPEATVTYTCEKTPYLYEEDSNLNIYTSGKVTAKIEVNLDDDDEGSIENLQLEYKLPNEEAVKITDTTTTVDLGSVDGNYNLTVRGKDRVGHSLKVTEKMENVEGPDADKMPKEAKSYGPSAGPLRLNFIIDSTAPVYTSSFNDPNGKDGDNAYYTGDATAAFTFEDENLDPDSLKAGKLTASGTDELNSGAEFTWKNPDSSASAGDNKESATAELKVSDEGAYRFTVSGKDKAGNALTMSETEAAKTDYTRTEQKETGFWSMTKIIDKTAPEATLTIGDYYKLILQGINGAGKKDVSKYEPFRKEQTASIDFLTKDKSPVSIVYTIKSNNKSDSVNNSSTWVNSKACGDADEYADNKSISDTVKGESQFEIYDVKVIDRAGNETSINETNIIFLDGTRPVLGIDVIKPQVKITATTAVTGRGPNGQNLYNQSVQLQFSVKDPNKFKSSSGLKAVRYSAYVDGEKVVDNEELKSWTPVSGEPEAGINPELEYSYNTNITIPKGGKYESNRIRIVLYAEDNAGNNDDAAILFGIDSEGPQIVVSYDNNSVQNGKYFKANRTATVTVTERNLGRNSNKIKIKTEVGVPGSWSYSAGGSSSGNSDKWIKRLVYNKDGDYTLTVSGTDALGNPAKITDIKYTGAAPREFTIDKTAPVIKVTFDNNSVRNRKYYKANRRATITIDEHNFRDADVKVNGSAKGPRGGNMAFPARGGFSSSGDTRRATIPFTREGSFKFNVNYTDLAGNPAKAVVIDEFVIDKTRPTVKIQNVINGGIYGGSVAPRAVFDDDNFSRSDSRFRFTGIRKVDRSELVPGFRANGEYGGSYTLQDFPHIKINDDIYTAYAESTDLAGNTTTVSVTFSVNRFGSAFDYNKDRTTENLVSKESGRYYTNEAENLQIREINVNHIKKYELTLDRGGNTVKLKEGKDYTVAKSESEMGTTYVYKINKDIVTDEGSYNIVVRSEDEAGNVNTNAAIRSEDKDSEVPVKFVYDVTNPTVSFLDEANNNNVIELKLDDKNSFRNLNELLLGIVPADDWALGAIQFVLSNNKGVISDSGVIDGKEFWDVMGEDGVKHFLQKIGNGTDVKTLEVTVWDAAGNKATQTYRIMVTKNIGQLALANWYWLLLLLAAAGAGYAYYRKRRDDDDDDDEDDEDDAA